MIEHYSFGRIIIDGKTYTSDVLIVKNTIHSWWRNQGHVLNPEDLDLVIKENPQTLVVGTGASGLMKIPEKTVQFIKDHNITLIAEKTKKAVEIFNIIKGTKAAALHLTC